MHSALRRLSAGNFHIQASTPPLAHCKCDRWTDLQQAHPLQPWVLQMSSRACAPPVSSLKSICTGTTWLLCPVFGVGGLSCSLRRDCPMRLPCAPATRLILSFRAATSSAKAELATSVSADMSGKAAPALGALLKSGQVAQPGFPVVARERPVDTPPSYDNDDWDNIQWKLFLFGLALYLPSCVGVVLPLFSRRGFRPAATSAPTRLRRCLDA